MEGTRDEKLALLKALSKELLPPQRTPDYVIYHVPHVEQLQDRKQLVELGTHLAKLGVHSEIVYIAHQGRVYYDVCDLPSAPDTLRPVHPEAEAVRLALAKTPYEGVVVKHHILDDIAYFVEALSECALWRTLDTHYHSMQYTTRTVAGQPATVVKVSYSVDDGESDTDITSSESEEESESE